MKRKTKGYRERAADRRDALDVTLSRRRGTMKKRRAAAKAKAAEDRALGVNPAPVYWRPDPYWARYLASRLRAGWGQPVPRRRLHWSQRRA